MTLVLASGSPRRRVLLRYLVQDFRVVAPDVDETLPAGPAAQALQAVAARKAEAVAVREADADAGEADPVDVVLAADTAVVVDGDVLGKAADEDEALRMLDRLSGRTHSVVTALAVRAGGDVLGHAEETPVRVDALPPKVRTAYLSSGAWQGKAGAYGIQDAGLAPFVRVPDGHWSNVVGLPLGRTAALLERTGVPCRRPPADAWLARHNPF